MLFQNVFGNISMVGIAAMRMQSWRRSLAFSITLLESRSPEETRIVEQQSAPIVGEMMSMNGFLGWVGVTVGARMMSISAGTRHPVSLFIYTPSLSICGGGREYAAFPGSG